ncbi:hypothetical protein [Alteromonas sp. M12]|uniref:hypothetical protein n=1 Tax=Alteromonas sp. M12 TaxID=3135644 RepID=UPI00319E079C
MFKQIVLFGISLAFITLLFSFYAAWYADIQVSLINNVLNSLIFAFVASIGFAVGCKITNFQFNFKQLSIAAIGVFLFNHSLQNILDTASKPIFIKILVIFAVALLLSWRLPVIFNKRAAKK